jgi:hypothetical protein
MRKLSILCAAAAITVAALAASTSAQAAYSLVRWQDSGGCLIWDNNFPTQPWPTNYVTVNKSIPTFMDALDLKNRMLASGACKF